MDSPETARGVRLAGEAAGPGRQARGDPVAVATLLVALALAGWILSFARMRGMDTGPGTDLGSLGWFLGVWVTMTAAMMLPSAAPMVLLFARVSDRSSKVSTPTWIFLAGYVAAWTTYGLVAYGLFRAIRAPDLGLLAWDAQGPVVAGGAIVAAGLYQFTPVKQVCLRHCRSPFHFVLHSWRPGLRGALRMGTVHGAYCVGCCWGLMLILFALGVMSLVWMGVVAGLVFAEKVLPFGARASRALAVGFVALGLWVAAAPGSVPGLTQPTAPAPMSRMAP